MIKRITGIIAASAIAFSALSTSTLAATKKFSDVDNDSTVAWASEYIYDMVEKGYIKGYEDGTFKPNNEVTRLEMFALMSRLLGSSDTVNADLLKIAVEKYKKTVSACNLSWGESEVSWLLYKNVIKESDLTTYIKNGEATAPMKRNEAAIIMTKVMYGDSDAETLDYDLEAKFSDAATIPNAAKKYVRYVCNAGLMSGMDGGVFSPNTSVVRSQIATILSKLDKKMNRSAEKVTITSISEDEVTYTNSNGKSKTTAISPNAYAFLAGEMTGITDIPENIEAIITIAEKKVITIDTLTTVPDETFEAIFLSKSTSNSKTRITLRKMNKSDSISYDCADGFSVTYQKSPSTLANFKANDYVMVSVSDSKIVSIDGQPKTITVSGAKLTDLQIDPDVKLTVSSPDKEYDGRSFYVADSVTVVKNGAIDMGLSDLYKGDTVTLTLEYGKVTAISATSSKQKITGVIKSITFAENSTMKIAANDKVTEYDIPMDVKITVDGKEGTMYDLRVGSSVAISTESNAITSIATVAAQSASGTITGNVTAVNTSFGFIKIEYTNADGYRIEETVYCKDSTTTIMNSSATTKKMKDITVGMSVTAKGTITNGAFSAKVILIE